MTRQGLAQLREYEGRELRLEFFFYTNNSANAEALNSKLLKLGYDARSDESASGTWSVCYERLDNTDAHGWGYAYQLDRNHVSAGLCE